MRGLSWLNLPRHFGRITTGGIYRPEIDGIRFLAIAFVVLWHLMERLSRGYSIFTDHAISAADQALIEVVPAARIGVMLFFSVSGFILASRYYAGSKAGTFSYGEYLIRRVSRIEPPYVLVLVGTFCFLTFTGYQPQLANNFWQGPQDLGVSLMVSLAYLHGVVFNDLPRLFPGGWSLEVEVQFYLIAPLLFIAYRMIPTDKVRLWVGATLIVASWLVAEASIAIWGWNERHMFTLVPYFFYFWCGVVIADINDLNAWGALKKHPAWCDMAGFGGVMLFAVSGWRQHAPGGQIELALLDLVRIAGIFGIFAGAILGRRFRALLSVPMVSLLGGACYSIYLCHVQIMQITVPLLRDLIFHDSFWLSILVGTLIELSLVLIGTMGFYLLIERPFMTKDWPRKLWSAVRGHRASADVVSAAVSVDAVVAEDVRAR